MVVQVENDVSQDSTPRPDHLPGVGDTAVPYDITAAMPDRSGKTVNIRTSLISAGGGKRIVEVGRADSPVVRRTGSRPLLGHLLFGMGRFRWDRAGRVLCVTVPDALDQTAHCRGSGRASTAV